MTEEERFKAGRRELARRWTLMQIRLSGLEAPNEPSNEDVADALDWLDGQAQSGSRHALVLRRMLDG